jgi:dihydroorotate dehydrogenase electron transfer subunit
MITGKAIRDLKVVKNIRLNPRHFLLEFMASEELPDMLPGQFVQVLVKNSPSTFLRRPFSIHSQNRGENTFQLLIQIKGEGTRHLSTISKGEKLNLIFPLGNSFSLPPAPEVLLVGGGCGVAPLLFLAQFLVKSGFKPEILTGWKSGKDIFGIGEYQRCGKVHIATEDGTEGEKGLVTGHSVFTKDLEKYSFIYCCGPDKMMRAVASIAGSHNIGCEVSLENTMACGFGVCLCCVTPTVHGNQRVCVEGPVFNTKELGWHKSE